MLLLTNTILIALLLHLTNTLTAATPVRDNSADDGGVSRWRRNTPVALTFLLKYGYLQTVPDGGDHFYSEEAITNAIKMFQKFVGLTVTGHIDKATMLKIKSARCGTPDVALSDSSTATNDNKNMPYAYSAMGSRWSKNTLTWRLAQLSAKLRESDQISAIQRALSLWAEVSPLNFQYSTNQPDIDIKFARGEHGDGQYNGFDGEGGVLAHAFGPGYGLGGDAHFDEDEFWTIDTGNGADLVTVAAHEFGHSLGLGHSNVPGALMAPYYVFGERLSLKDDDIQGIQAIYGSRPKAPTSSLPKTPSTRASITTTSTTTRSTTTASSSTKMWKPDFCDANFRLDAVSQGPDGFLYAFRNDLVYKFSAQGMEIGYPKLISHVFQQAPGMAVNAVTFVPETRKTYIFKDYQVWRYTNFSLDEHYPKIWTYSSNFIPSAALTLTNRGRSQIFLFGNDDFWEWNTQTENIVPGYPLMIQTYFPYAPKLPDAAFMNQQGHFFFFKGNSYKKMEHRGRDAGFRTLGPLLFGSICGGQPELLNQLQPPSRDGQILYDLEHSEYSHPEFSSLIWTLINRTFNQRGHNNKAQNSLQSKTSRRNNNIRS